MAFRRTSFSALKSQKKEYFESIYKFSKKVPNFKEGSDVYVLPLGLENGFYETVCHRIIPHKVDGQTIGYGGSSYAVYVKCNGVDEEGHETPSLCCELAKKEKERCGEDWSNRIISGRSRRVHLPILILGNSIGDTSKTSYPITKVSILNDYKSEAGLKFSYLDMAASSFMNDIILAYGRKLKEEGVIDYDMNEESEEFYNEVRERLRKTVIKIHGVSKQGFAAAMKEYSFFPFDNPTIASGSGDDERKAVTMYYKHKGIMAKVDEYLQLFNIEVDNLIKTWNEKDLIEYYNSATGKALNASIDASAVATAQQEVSKPVEKVEVIEEVSSSVNPSNDDEYEEDGFVDEYANDNRPAPSDDEMEAILNDPFDGEDPVEEKEPVAVGVAASEPSMDDFSFDSEGEEDFFGD